MNERLSLPFPAFRLFGAALAVAAVDPPHGFMASSSPLVATVLAVFALWAAAPVVRRPVLALHRWVNQVSRYRNTVFAGACAAIAAAGRPQLWLMITDAVLLLGYLLALDAVTAGPVGIRQLRAGWPAGLAAAGTALVLALAQLTSAAHSGAAADAGRWVAAVGGTLAALALALAFLSGKPKDEQAQAQAKALAAAAAPVGRTDVPGGGSAR